MHIQAINFSIEAYQQMVVQDATHHVETREGKPVRILCTDRQHKYYSIMGLGKSNDNEETILNWTYDGRFAFEASGPGDYDLIIVPNPPKVLGYINVFGNAQSFGSMQPTREKCDGLARNRTGIICITEDMIQPV